MIDGVHSHASHPRTLSEPTHASGLAVTLVHVIFVANSAYRRDALLENEAKLVGRKLYRNVIAVGTDDQRAGARGASELRALSERQLDVVHLEADRDILEGQRVAYLDSGFRAAHHGLPHRQAGRSDDIPLLTIDVVDQRDIGRPVGIVLYGRDLAGDAVLVAAPINLAVLLLVTAALAPHRDAAVGSAARVLLLTLGKSLLRLVADGERIVHHLHPVPESGGYRPESLNSHSIPLFLTRLRRP